MSSVQIAFISLWGVTLREQRGSWRNFGVSFGIEYETFPCVCSFDGGQIKLGRNTNEHLKHI